MKSFKINDEYEAVCEHQNTRSGFRHVATLLRNGEEIDTTKVCYINRTWESFEFQTVLDKLLEKTKILDDDQRKEFIRNGELSEKKRVDQMFKSLKMVASLGEVFTDDKAQSNKWKKRMLEAGGLDFPEDWESLSETEREKRLNKVLEKKGVA